MNAMAPDARTPPRAQLDFARYVAQYPAITPQVVFRRLRLMGLFFVLGAIGIAGTAMLIGLDVPVSEPARLLTAFGFVAAAIVIVATVFSAGLLLWGGFISQYVANLDSKAEMVEMPELAGVPAYAVALQATKATEVIMQTVAANVAYVANIFEQVAPESVRGEVGDLRKERLAMEVTFKRIEEAMSVEDQQRVYAYMQVMEPARDALRLFKPLTKEEMQRLLEQYDAVTNRLD